MKRLHFDLTCGISGDMMLGALLALGGGLEDLNALLAALPLEGLQISFEPGRLAGFSGVKARPFKLGGMPETQWIGKEAHHPEHCHPVHHHDQGHGHDHVHLHHQDHHHHDHHDHHHAQDLHADSGHGPCPHSHDFFDQEGHHHGGAEHRHLSDVQQVIQSAPMSQRAKALALRTFELIADAEAQAHGLPVDQVHFHEVGALDSLADVIGCCFLFDRLGCPPCGGTVLNLGGGFLRCAHGRLAVPAPAVALLARGFDVISEGTFERATPTGVALLKAFGLEQRGISGRLTERVCSLGDRDDGTPNGLVICVEEQEEGGDRDRVLEFETWIDDMNPQDWPPLMERLFEAGALDLFLTPGLMKKGRPGHCLTVLCRTENEEALLNALFLHSTALGVRRQEVHRRICQRKERLLSVNGSPVGVKSAFWQGGEVNRSYEFEDLKKGSAADGASVEQWRRRAVREDQE